MEAERTKRARAAMAALGLDALVCRLPENVLLLTGSWPLIGMSFLLFPLEGEPLLVLPLTEEAEARADLEGVECATFPFGVLGAGDAYEAIGKALRGRLARRSARRVGFEGSFESVAPPWNAAEPSVSAAATRGMLEGAIGAERLVDATGLLHAQRARKTPLEQRRMRAANEIAAMGLEAFLRGAEEGRSGVDLVALVESTVMCRGSGHQGSPPDPGLPALDGDRGVRRARAFAQVATGAAETAVAYRPMEISTPRRLAKGDLAVLELAVVADGFWADRTRVRVIGRPSDRVRAAYAAVREAQRAAIARIRPGVRAGEVDAAAREVIRSAGLEKEFCHITGHGLGFRYHEPTPFIAPGAEGILEEGMTHSVEPGVYHPAFGGIRLEEDVLVTREGAEILGPCGNDLEAGGSE